MTNATRLACGGGPWFRFTRGNMWQRSSIYNLRRTRCVLLIHLFDWTSTSEARITQKELVQPQRKLHLFLQEFRSCQKSGAISQQNCHLTRNEPNSKRQTQKTSWWSSSIFESVSERRDALRPGARGRALEMCLCILFCDPHSTGKAEVFVADHVQASHLKGSSGMPNLDGCKLSAYLLPALLFCHHLWYFEAWSLGAVRRPRRTMAGETSCHKGIESHS